VLNVYTATFCGGGDDEKPGKNIFTPVSHSSKIR